MEKETKENNCQKTSHISLAHQITLAEGILTEEEINCSPPCSQESHEDNVPEGCAHGCFRYKKMSWL